ncbi:hypothetical protein EVAR_35575_1 [Eumeta japonica]|uniref:Uncharacterized protein n=1 Tax=Eumeta variegata TaxID=151549 RepID=A0A4C1XJT1_EUMVA|nr:hypothetical protein EVAR_35575_1 [Eumeta japonica]
MKLCRSELPANDVMRKFNTPRPFLLLPHVPTLRHCDALGTTFTAAEFQTIQALQTQQTSPFLRCANKGHASSAARASLRSAGPGRRLFRSTLPFDVPECIRIKSATSIKRFKMHLQSLTTVSKPIAEPIEPIDIEPRTAPPTGTIMN